MVGGIEPRKSPAYFGIDGIDLLAEAGSQVNRLAERIAEQRLQPAAGVPPVDLCGIARGIADSAEVGVISKGDDWRWPGGQRQHYNANALVKRCAGAGHHRPA